MRNITAAASRSGALSLALLTLALLAGCTSRVQQEAVLAGAGYTDAPIQYQLDREATAIRFTVGDTRGQFRAVDARLGFLDNAVESAVLEVTIATSSLDLFNPVIEQMLKGSDWFDVASHPDARFETAQVLENPDQSLTVIGTLTIKDITQPLELNVRFPGGGGIPALQPPSARIAFEATGQFLRSTFGMNDLMSFAPDEVALQIEGFLDRIRPAP